MKFQVGQRVKKIKGDYKIDGEFRGYFTLYEGGPLRCIVAHSVVGLDGTEQRFAHIYSEDILEAV